MKSIFYNSYIILAFAITLLGISSCSQKTEQKPIITVTIEPQRFLLEKLVGDRFEIQSLLSQGSNPETYEPSMDNLMAVEKSQAYFCIGNIGFEMSITEKAKSLNPNIKIYNNSKNIKLIHGSHKGIAQAHHSHEHKHNHHCHEIDPHVWTSVVNAKIIAANMCNALCELNPQDINYFKENLSTLNAELDSLDSSIKHQLEPLRGNAFIVWHPSLSYFARDYGLKQISMEFEGKEIPVRYLKAEIDSALASNAKVFFFQKEFDSRQVENVNNQIGAKLVTINLMNYNWDSELKNIANALTSEQNN